MKTKFHLKKILLSTVLTLVFPFALAVDGGGDAGGAQGAVTSDGKFYFLDILSQKELSKLNFVSSNEADIISDIKCSDEEYRNLREYTYNVYSKDGVSGYNRNNTIFTSEFAEARRLLKIASEPLLSPFSDCEFVRMPNLEELMANLENQGNGKASFYGTAFEIPQLKDSTQISSSNQNQIAYFNRGIVYFQIQALLRLHKNKIQGRNQIHGVFIKETLRYTNLRYRLGLTNKDLELATYYIYHEQFDNFNNSEFANKLKLKFSADQCPQSQDLDDIQNAGNRYGINFYPNFLEKKVEKSAPGLYLHTPSWHEFDYNPEKIWSTKTGKIIERKSCEGRILSRKK